ncbi:hypothetical protein G7Z17_g2833 [Cylindrodendrum hubeiense]|uniref:Uncharacterized protein n=1 Tax=Cylindrodendrum hubeiense TaxID=595255 RepID=A0A9P5HI19_9HYPO|nr:hypothetical protein G7Z17_g2833 [Cylindrodendrum hubeiense]
MVHGRVRVLGFGKRQGVANRAKPARKRNVSHSTAEEWRTDSARWLGREPPTQQRRRASSERRGSETMALGAETTRDDDAPRQGQTLQTWPAARRAWSTRPWPWDSKTPRGQIDAGLLVLGLNLVAGRPPSPPVAPDHREETLRRDCGHAWRSRQPSLPNSSEAQPRIPTEKRRIRRPPRVLGPSGGPDHSSTADMVEMPERWPPVAQ